MAKIVEEGVKEPPPQQTSEKRFFWIGLFGFFILLSETGVRQVMNVFVPYITEEFNCTKIQADTAAIVTPSATSLMAGPIAALIYQLLGARICICIGSALCFGGFLLGSFSSGINSLYLFGLMIGFGCALMRNSIISVQCEYFVERRNFVMAFISIGPGIGIFVLPRIIMPLIEAMSWKSAWQVMSGMYIICFIMGIFITRQPSSKPHTLAELLGVTVWKRFDFILHVTASFCASVVCIIYVSNILTLMREEDIPFPAHVYSYQGIASIVGRAILTIFMWKLKVHIAIIMIFNYSIAQVSLFSALFCYGVWAFRVQNFFSGLGMGMFQATLAPFLLAIVGPSQLPAALGYTNLINGLAAFTGIRVSGVIVNSTKSFRSAFLVATIAGSLAIVFAIINSIIILWRDRLRRKPSISQMKNDAELQALRHISASES